MQFISNHKLSIIFILLVAGFFSLLITNIAFIRFNGTNVPVPEIPREKITIGSGEQLNYLILGDSTSVSQGGTYKNGYAVKSAEYLATNRTVTYQNFGVSGARIHDVLSQQLPASDGFVPDLVLVAIGSNDVTHRTDFSSIEQDMKQIIAALRSRNSEVKIVFTGAGSMGDIKRFIQPTKWLLGIQAQRVNNLMERVSKDESVTFAYIARETGDEFAQNPALFAQDNYHPSDEGYAVWSRVIIDTYKKLGL